MARTLVFGQPAGILLFRAQDPVTFRLDGFVDRHTVRQGGVFTPHYLASDSQKMWMRLFVHTKYASLGEMLIVEQCVTDPDRVNLLVRVTELDRVLHHQKYFLSSAQQVRDLFYLSRASNPFPTK